MSLKRTHGHTWVVPEGFWVTGDGVTQRQTPYGGAVAIQTNSGWLLLAHVIEDVETGVVERVLVKPEELKLSYRQQ